MYDVVKDRADVIISHSKHIGHNIILDFLYNLLQEYWLSYEKYGNPKKIKNIVGSKNKKFLGYNQQDSNEFMTVFLDLLGEDLNSATKKVYRELYEQSLWRTCEYVMNCFMNAVFQDDSDLKQKDQEILVQYYKCTLFGLVMDWMSHDMQTDLQAPFQHLLELQDVIVHQILIRQNPENAQNSDKF